MKFLTIVVVLCIACGTESSGPPPPQPATADRIDHWNFGADVALLTRHSAHDLIVTVSDRSGGSR